MRCLVSPFFAFMILAIGLGACVKHKELRIFNFTAPDMPYAEYVENADNQEAHAIMVGKAERSYQLYDGGGGDSPRAAILLLHGSGRSGVSLVEKWMPVADAENLVLIGPTALNAKWRYGEDVAFIDAVLKEAQEKYNIDPARIYLFGHSDGATFALYLSVIRSDVFAASVIHAGMFSKRDERLVANATRKIPVALMVGDRDKIFPVGRVKDAAQAFADNGHETALYLFEGHDHWYYDLSDYLNGFAWEFMRQYELE